MHRGILLLKGSHQALHDCINDKDQEDHDGHEDHNDDHLNLMMMMMAMKTREITSMLGMSVVS